MCVFCDIIDGKIPSEKIYEDDYCLAILDISQLTWGHTLVMPKRHIENILEADDATLEHLILVTRELSRKITANVGAKGCNIFVNTGEAAGQSVPHLHFHIVPRYGPEDAVTTSFKADHEPYDLKAVAQSINKQ